MDAFFTQFHEFMVQLVKAYPDDDDFPAYDQAVMLLQKVNPGLVISEFTKHVGPFEDTIRIRNDDFFLKHDFNEFDPENAMENVIQKLKGYWLSATVQSKNSIWGYIILLLDISKRCQ